MKTYLVTDSQKSEYNITAASYEIDAEGYLHLKGEGGRVASFDHLSWVSVVERKEEVAK